MSDIPADIRQTAEEWLTKPVADQYGNHLAYFTGNHYRAEAATVIAMAILAERERHGWQNIDTVPKDGTIVDLWHVKGFRVVDEWWDAEDGWTGGWLEDQFTHWIKPPIANP